MKGRRIMAVVYADELRKLAAILDDAKSEVDLARQQSTKLKHLYVRTRRAAVQAARAVVAAVDTGFTAVWPIGSWLLSSQRNPDDPDRPPITVQLGDLKGTTRSIKIGSGCNPDGSIPDDTAFALWMAWMCPILLSPQAISKADACAFDFPKFKTDEHGRILGRDGTPLKWIEKVNPKTGEQSGWELQGPEGLVTDDYDEADALEHIRCQAADWADACAVAARLIRTEMDNFKGARNPDESCDSIGESSLPPPNDFDWLIDEVLVPARTVGQIVESFKDDPDRAGAAFTSCTARLRLTRGLEQVRAEISSFPDSVAVEVRAIANIWREAHNLIGFHDAAQHIAKSDLEGHAKRGWEALLHHRNKGGPLSWATPNAAQTVQSLPASIASIPDVSLRQRTEEAWRAVVRLKGCILPWHQWVFRLKDTGDADPGEALWLFESAALAAEVLCRLGIESESFTNANRREITNKFPAVPGGELEQLAIAENGRVLAPAVQAWQKIYDLPDAITRLGNLNTFEGELYRIKLLLESAPSTAFLSRNVSAAIVIPTALAGSATPDADSHDATTRLVGVTLFDAAQYFESSDDRAASNLVNHWHDAKAITAEPIGRCPTDGRMQLYRLPETLADIVRLNGLDGREKNKLCQHLKARLRAPRA
jgi:hypothetical protein